jgi:membrane-associated protein
MFDVQPILALIHSYSAFVGPLSFSIALLGSLLGINLIIPAGAFLSSIGVLVGAGIVPWTIIIWGALGAMAGSSASYSAGLRLGAGVPRIRIFRRWPGLMDRAQTLFIRYGFAAILIGYFSGPLRAPMASIAAIAGMRRIQFELANLVSAFVWAGFAVGIGAVPGILIDPSSPWLLIAPALVPLITIALSAAILLLRRGKWATDKFKTGHQGSKEASTKTLT